MRIIEVKVEVRVNLGNYEHEMVGFTAALPEGSDTMAVAQDLRAMAYAAIKGVNRSFSGEANVQPKHPVDLERTAPVKEEAIETPKAESKVVKKTAKKAAPVASPSIELVEDEAEVETEVEEKPAKKKAKIGQPYSRTNDIHKSLLGQFLNSAFPTWKKDIEKYKAISTEMEGQDFLDSEGMILQSFKDSFTEKA